MHNKKGIPLLSLLINCISARSESQILSLKDEYNFHFSNFLIVVLCNVSADSWFAIISFLKPLLENVLSEIYKPTKQDLFYINHVLDF